MIVSGGRLAALLLAAGLAGVCSSAPSGDARYVRDIEAARAAKDAAFRSSESPIPPDKRATLLPLAYFPVDPAYAVPAAFRENPPGLRPRVEMQTSGHEPRQMELVGVLEFTLFGHPCRLAAFVEAGQPADHLFVPFTDTTSGSETYPAGRYLDIHRSSTGIYVVDFNRAYSPYCAYNTTYDCPYPPRGNRLAVAVRAGERLKAAR